MFSVIPVDAELLGAAHAHKFAESAERNATRACYELKEKGFITNALQRVSDTQPTNQRTNT